MMTPVSLPLLDGREHGTLALRRVERDLRALTAGEVRFSRHERLLYATDASLYQVEPIGVVEPTTIDEAAAVTEYCGRHRLPILPRGGGTSLAGQTVNHAIVIDFSRHCRRLIDVDPDGQTANVEPGIVLADLNRQLLPHGLAFGPDVATASHANLGGLIGNNSAGAHSVLYGRTVEHLRALDVVLWDGLRLHLNDRGAVRDDCIAALTRAVAEVVEPLAAEIDARYPRIKRHVNGYNLDLFLAQMRASTPGTFDRVNLAHLFCGSEGTLGVTLGAQLDLVNAPRAKSLGIIAFPDVDTALEAVTAILETGPAAVELVDEMLMELAWRNAECQRYARLVPTWREHQRGAVLYVEYFADDQDELDERFERLGAMFDGHPKKRYDDPASMAAAWKLRASGEPLLYGLPGRRKPLTFIEDAAVDPADLPEFIRRFRAILEQHGTSGAYYAHASVGCLHVRPLIDLQDERDRHAMRQIAEEVTDLVLEFSGALSGEHGDGRLRSNLLERYYGMEICRAFRRIKAIFDPHNLMNPGNIVAPEPMLQRLRVKPSDRFIGVPHVRTYFRYENERGFDHAVEMCNGAGVCRSTQGGTMCPSYRATRDERHATRGRGNALRLAITGQLGSADGTPAWNDSGTLETLDLCLACKACKCECPSNVDIARLKAEYLAQGYDANGVAPLRARAFGRVRPALEAASRFPRLANSIAGLGPVRALLRAAIGLDPRRSLPKVQTSLLAHAGSRRRHVEPGTPRVIVFADCFTTFLEPSIGEAIIDVLHAFGYGVVLVDAGCCGRSLISVGLLDEAIRAISDTAKRLEEACTLFHAEAVIVAEPSCQSSVLDDWRDLRLEPPSERIERLAAMICSIEQFLESRWNEHPRRPTLQFEGGPSRQLLHHGHCHQKALWSTDATMSLLRRVEGASIVDLDSGCCGMAGSFGYTRDHFDLSMQVGELALFPAIRSAKGSIILAPGTSCRHQIHDGLGRRALHPVELLRECLCVNV